MSVAVVGDDTQSLEPGFVVQVNRIATAAHVVAAAKSPVSVWSGRENIRARVVGTDAQQDLALLEITAVQNTRGSRWWWGPHTSLEPAETDLARIWTFPDTRMREWCARRCRARHGNFSATGASASGRLRTSRARMCPIRKPSAPTEFQPAVPPCPGCHDSAFVKQEQVLTGGTAISFWTCTSCLRSWPAPKPRMAKADLNRSK